MNIKIETTNDTKILCARRTGAYGAGNAAVMSHIKEYAAANGLMNEKTIILGIARDNPQTTPPELCRYDACIVSDSEPTAADIFTDVLPSGKYAVFTVEHTASAVAAAWAEIFPELARAGLVPDGEKPIIERYAAEIMAGGNCEICVPIK